MSAWLSEKEWAWAQESLPIVCVDAMPVSFHESELRIGLILRETPQQGQRWCLVGGRLRMDESLSNALNREWQSAFGEQLSPTAVSKPYIVEYQRSYSPGHPWDPRKHAVSATYSVLTRKTLTPHGTEALDFRWFAIDELDDRVVGFGQESVVAALVGSSQFRQLIER